VRTPGEAAMLPDGSEAFATSQTYKPLTRDWFLQQCFGFYRDQVQILFSFGAIG